MKFEIFIIPLICVQYKIAKPEQESESEDEEDDDVFGPSSRRKENGNWSEDPVARE